VAHDPTGELLACLAQRGRPMVLAVSTESAGALYCPGTPTGKKYTPCSRR
jgi:hypothetical protein